MMMHMEDKLDYLEREEQDYEEKFQKNGCGIIGF